MTPTSRADVRPRRAGYEILKRTFDLAVAVSAAVVLSPLLLIIAAAIKLDSAGAALYRGRRTGRDGHPFDMYKFRTMKPGADLSGSATARNDPRVTRIGRFLRRHKLDELPQLLNVIRGDMSIVGPRPEVEEHTRDYDERERLILTVRPGITDYASLRFFNLADALGEEDPRRAHEAYLTRVRAQKNALRVEYVLRRSFLEDVRIVLLTAAAIVRGAVRRDGRS